MKTAANVCKYSIVTVVYNEYSNQPIISTLIKVSIISLWAVNCYKRAIVNQLLIDS